MGKDQGERKKQPSIQRRPMVVEIELETRFGRDITNLCQSNVTPEPILSDFSRKNSLLKTLKTSMRLRKQANNIKIKRSKQRTESEDSETGKIDPKELGMDINNSKHCELASVFHKDILNHLQQQEVTFSNL